MLSQIKTSLSDPLLRLAFICILLMGSAVASIHPFQSIIGVEMLGFSNAAYAGITTIGALLSVAAAVAVGIYTDQTGKYRQVLIICIWVGALAGAVMYFAPSKISFIITHVILFPIGATTFTQYFALGSLAAERNTALDKDMGMSIIRAGFAGSFALTPPIWAIFIAAGTSLYTVYGYAALVNVIVFMLVMISWPRDHNAAFGDKSGISFFEALRELSAFRVSARLALIAIIIGINGLYNILLGLLVVNNLGGTEADVGIFAGGVALVEVPVMLIGAAFLKQVTKSGMIFIGVLIYVGFLAVIGIMPSMQSAWWLIIPAGIGAGILLSVTVGYVQDLMADRPGAGSALVSVSHFGGSIVAAAIFATASSVESYVQTAWLGCAVGCVAGIILFVMDGAKMRTLSKPA